MGIYQNISLKGGEGMMHGDFSGAEEGLRQDDLLLVTQIHLIKGVMNGFAWQLITQAFSLEVEEMGEARIKTRWKELVRAAAADGADRA